jgi:hypothetical protein
LDLKRRFKNHMIGKPRLVRPRVPPKKRSQRAHTVGVSMMMAMTAAPQPRMNKLMVEAR